MVHFNNDWDEILAGEFDQEYYKRIRYFLKQEYADRIGADRYARDAMETIRYADKVDNAR